VHIPFSKNNEASNHLHVIESGFLLFVFVRNQADLEQAAIRRTEPSLHTSSFLRMIVLGVKIQKRSDSLH
jgi:hypothetical protein